MNRKFFFDALRKSLFGGFSPEQVAGCEAILDAWAATAPTADARFVAYSLATAYHETAATMQPIAEYGRGAGRAYGKKDAATGQTYYGRGYVQLTWKANYEKAENELRKRGFLKTGESLVKDAALAMRPDLAAPIMIFGMTEGWFTGRKLADYFKGGRSDWVDARRIINGTDKAAKIAGYGLHFLDALEAASAPAKKAA